MTGSRLCWRVSEQGVQRMGADSPRQKVVMSWSGGKDSALALHELRADPRYEVVALMTSVSEEFRRVSHHGVREELL
jgi:tRNA(Ile)-lysidine synthase TilS/MesJ